MESTKTRDLREAGMENCTKGNPLTRDHGYDAPADTGLAFGKGGDMPTGGDQALGLASTVLAAVGHSPAGKRDAA